MSESISKDGLPLQYNLLESLELGITATFILLQLIFLNYELTSNEQVPILRIYVWEALKVD